jgi:hypothetical protein
LKRIICIFILFYLILPNCTEEDPNDKSDKKSENPELNQYFRGAPYSIKIDEKYLYIAGYREPTEEEREKGIDGFYYKKIHIEKRDKISGELVSEFGNNGSVNSNPIGKWARALDIEIDEDYFFISGYNSIDIINIWQIEKRDLFTGDLIKEFGNEGIISLSETNGNISSIILDEDFLYISGTDKINKIKYYRLEKRNSKTGDLIKTFGTDGIIITDNNTTSIDNSVVVKYSLLVEGDYLFLIYGGVIEKRNKETGKLIYDFGSDGFNAENDSYFENDYYYQSGFIIDDFIFLSRAGLIEKRNKYSAELISRWETNGSFWGMTSDYNFLYNAGWESIKPEYEEGHIIYYLEWRIEKRDISNGTLEKEFGNNGIINSYPYDYGSDRALDIIFDNGIIYIVGIEDTCDNLYGCKAPHWRIEKRDAFSGNYIKDFGENGFISQVPKID